MDRSPITHSHTGVFGWSKCVDRSPNIHSHTGVFGWSKCVDRSPNTQRQRCTHIWVFWGVFGCLWPEPNSNLHV